MSKLILSIITVVSVIIAIAAVYTNPEFKKNFAQWTETKHEVPKILTDKKQIIKFARDNMQSFAFSVKAKDMTHFYNNLSPFWQKRTSVEVLNKNYAPFMNNDSIDLTLLSKIKPLILKEGTKMTDRNDLHISGYYNTTPVVVRFEQTLKYGKDDTWKLVEFFIQLK
jgi:hypothetical protein